MQGKNSFSKSNKKGGLEREKKMRVGRVQREILAEISEETFHSRTFVSLYYLSSLLCKTNISFMSEFLGNFP